MLINESNTNKENEDNDENDNAFWTYFLKIVDMLILLLISLILIVNRARIKPRVAQGLDAYWLELGNTSEQENGEEKKREDFWKIFFSL